MTGKVDASAQETGTLTVAAFYVDLSPAIVGAIQESFSTVTVLRPVDMLAATVESARRAMPGCRITILTDRRTRVPAELGAEVLRYDVTPARLMEGRMQAWREVLLAARGHVAFVDGDILIRRDLSPLFETEFDVALTYRDEEQWPINAGVMLFHRARLAGGAGFLARCLDIYRKRFADAAAWGGDQDALREMVRGVDFARSDSFMQRVDGFDVLLLPCATYNFATQDERMDGDYPDKAILHYKGRRKYAMLPAWERMRRATGEEPALVNAREV